MSVICQCSSCKAKYELGQQYAGRKIKCPKCGAVVEVPGPPRAAEAGKGSQLVPGPILADTKTGTVPRTTPAASAVIPLSSAADLNAVANGEGDNLGFLREHATTHGRAARTAEHSASPHERPAVGGETAAPPAAGKAPRLKKKSLAGWTVAAMIGSVAVVAVVIGGVYRASRKAGDNAASVTNPHMAEADANAPQVTFTFNWPESERSGATLTINGELRAIPATGDFKVKLPKVTRAYRFVLERKGYAKKEFSRPLMEDDDYNVTQWESENRGIEWEQDFAAAKKAAADQHKNVLIVFDASDAKASAYHSSRLHDSVLSRPEFAERAGREYICVYIDNPEKDDAKRKVRDLKQNRDITKKFRITVFPTVVVTDPDSRPFGIMEDYRINGITPFLDLMDQWQRDRATLFRMLDRIKVGGEKPDLGILRDAISFLQLNKLDRIYQHTIEGWTAQLPKGEGFDVTAADAAIWMQRFERGMTNPDEVKSVIDDFDQWKKSRTFKDHDIAAGLHYAAAFILFRIDERAAAAAKCKEALAYDPQDPELRGRLEELADAVSGKANEPRALPNSSGSGFCIAEGNYVLTNHHVIEDAKKIMVHLDGEKVRHLAHLVADNPNDDMAVLKIDLPAGKTLTPIPLAAKDVGKGEEVCAIGWPGLLSHNLSSTLTRGVISTVRDRDGYLVVDCKIEHGNSGGPLCRVSDCCVAGMVFAKTAREGILTESYGMAIPASRLIKFLGEKLPPDIRSKIPRPTGATGSKLSDVAKTVQASVVYVENYQ